MTVKELKEKLKNVPDDFIVLTSVVDDGGGLEFTTTHVSLMVGHAWGDDYSDFLEDGTFKDYEEQTGNKLISNCIVIGR